MMSTYKALVAELSVIRLKREALDRMDASGINVNINGLSIDIDVGARAKSEFITNLSLAYKMQESIKTKAIRKMEESFLSGYKNR